jgi:hypothetical protein
VALLLGGPAYGQDLTGVWQGTLQAGSQPLRVIVKLKKGDDGAWSGAFSSVDQGDWGSRSDVSAVVLQGQSITFVVSAICGSYQGTLGTDGTSIEGTWKQRQPLPLTLRRATAETAWKDPAAHTIQFITVDKNVKLQVQPRQPCWPLRRQRMYRCRHARLSTAGRNIPTSRPSRS